MKVKDRKPESGADQYRKLQREYQELADWNARLLDQAGAATKRVIGLEKEIQEFKETNHELAELAIEREKELNYQQQARTIAENDVVDLTKENTELKELLKNLIAGMNHIAENHPTMGAHTKIMKDLRRAEQFLEEEA